MEYTKEELRQYLMEFAASEIKKGNPNIIVIPTDWEDDVKDNSHNYGLIPGVYLLGEMIGYIGGMLED